VRTRIVLAAGLCASLLAACGGSGRGGDTTASKSSAPYGPKSSPYSLSKCMRANGLSHFPDPAQGSGGLGFPGGVIISIQGDLVVDGVSFSGPALKQAEGACKSYLPGGGAPPPTISAEAKKQAVKFAECMRANGVPNFPDPSFNAPGSAGNKQRTLSFDTSSPAFEHATKVCGDGIRIKVGGTVQGP
jgi:hypothetical protein